MKVAVTSTGPSLNDQVEARLGRAPYYIFIDTETMQYEAVHNPNIAAGGGAGIQSAQFMAERGVRYILTGNCGPNALQVFNAAGIHVIEGMTGTVRQAVDQIISDTAGVRGSANTAVPLGIGGGRGMGGRGQGMGQGRGMRQGRGMGRGMGRGIPQGVASNEPGTPIDNYRPRSGTPGIASQMTTKDERAALMKQADDLEKQIRDMQRRIDQLQGIKSHAVARVDPQVCRGCGMCDGFCPVDAITVNDVATIDASKCIGCGACVDECPLGAISLG